MVPFSSTSMASSLRGEDGMTSENRSDDSLCIPERCKLVDSELEAFLPKEVKPFQDERRSQVTLWKILTVIFSFSTFILLGHVIVLKWYNIPKCETKGNRTSDFGPVQDFIEYTPVLFSGNVRYFANGSTYIPPGTVSYVGDPSPEIDAAWAELVKARDPIISEEEAKTLWPHNYQDFWHHKKQGYVVGFEVFHSLHCLNSLRKRLSPDYYDIDNSHNLHRDHCIDQIRQNLMCSVDMTPYGTRYNKAVDHNYADSNVVHMCRNFEKIRQWVFDRYYNPPPQSSVPDIQDIK